MIRISDNLSIEHFRWVYHAGFTVVCSCLGIVVVICIYQPLLNHIEHQQHRLTLASQLGEHQAKQIQRKDELLQQLQIEQLEMEQIRQSIPDTVGADQFMGQLEKLAQKCDLKIADFRPGASRLLLNWEETTVRLTSMGHYAGIYQFMDELKLLPRRNRILSLQLNPESPEPGNCTVNIEIGIFSHLPQKVAGHQGGLR